MRQALKALSDVCSWRFVAVAAFAVGSILLMTGQDPVGCLLVSIAAGVLSLKEGAP